MLLTSHMSIRALIEWLGKNGLWSETDRYRRSQPLGFDIAKNAMQAADSGIRSLVSTMIETQNAGYRTMLICLLFVAILISCWESSIE